MDAGLRVRLRGKLQFFPFSLILPAALSRQSERLTELSERVCLVLPHLKPSRVCPCLHVSTQVKG